MADGEIRVARDGGEAPPEVVQAADDALARGRQGIRGMREDERKPPRVAWIPITDEERERLRGIASDPVGASVSEVADLTSALSSRRGEQPPHRALAEAEGDAAAAEALNDEYRFYRDKVRAAASDVADRLDRLERDARGLGAHDLAYALCANARRLRGA